MAFSWPTFAQPGRTDTANSAATASDAPDNDRIESPSIRENCRGRNRASIVKEPTRRQLI